MSLRTKQFNESQKSLPSFRFGLRSLLLVILGIAILLGLGVAWYAQQAAARRPTAFRMAARAGRVERMQGLLQQDPALINHRTQRNRTVLHEVIMQGHAGSEVSVKFLLENGADLNVRHGHSDFTPLHEAIWRDKQEIVRVLLTHGADNS